MGNPTRSQIHVDRALTDVSVSFIQDARNFIAMKVFPQVRVRKQSDLFFVYDRGDLLRIDTQKRAPGSESAGSGFRIASDSYFANVYALHKDVADQDRDNADEPINLHIDSTEFLMQDIMMRLEVDWFDTFFAPSIWGADFTPGTLWDVVNSVPIEDISAQIEVITSQTGVSPLDMTFTVSPDVWQVLRNHPEVVDRIKHTQTGIVTEQILAALLGIKEVLIGRGIRNTAVEGATPVVGYIAAVKDALLTYAPASPSLKKPSAGYTFVWIGRSGTGANGPLVKRFRIEERESDRIETSMSWDQKLVSADSGVFFDDVIT